MRLCSLKVENWRNLAQAGFCPGPGLTVLCGDNGQGKTNLLEAVWSLTGAKSFRGAKDAELIRRGEAFAVVEALTEQGSSIHKMRLTCGGPDTPRPGRTISLNDTDPVKASKMAGQFTAVVFDPNHLSLIKAGPEGRRRFLDLALCQLYPAYLAALRRYTRVMVQKNAFLKACREDPSFSAAQAQLLDVYNRQLAQYGSEIGARRADYIYEISKEAAANYREITTGKESLTVNYRPSTEEPDLYEAISAHRAEELRAGFCLIGPHRDELELEINQTSARSFGSQGQQRSAVLSLKLAEADMAAKVMGDTPLMLMDDVLSELDEGRRGWLLNRMKGMQTIVTACDREEFLKTDGLLYRVENGQVSPV